MSESLLEHQHCIGPVCVWHSDGELITNDNVDDKLQEVKESITSMQTEIKHYNESISSAIKNREQRMYTCITNSKY